jgi:hypothetical protein
MYSSILFLQSQEEQRGFSLLQNVTTGLGPIQPSIGRFPGALSPRVKRPKRETTYLQLVPNLRMSGAIYPVPHKPPWRVLGQIYFHVHLRNDADDSVPTIIGLYED